MGNAGSTYDWVSPEGSRTPEDFPYSYDAHYLWRDFDPADETSTKTPKLVVYSDRMRDENPEKFDRFLVPGIFPERFIYNMTRSQCEAFVAGFYDGKYIPVGYARATDVPSGTSMGIFFLIPS